MMKTIKTKQFKITALMLVAIVTLSCAFYNPAKVQAQELELQSASIQTFASTGETSTSSQLVGTENEYVSIGVFITGATNNNYNYNNGKYVHNGTSWRGGMYYEGSGTQQISAYYPYKEDVSDYGFTVNASDQIDYMCATPTTLTSSAVTLTMKHVMAKIVLAPTMGTEVNSDDAIAKIEVGGMYASGRWAVSTNTWSEETGSITLEMTNNDGTYEVLVIPMESCTSFPVTITMKSGKVFKTNVAVNSELASGTQYTVNLQVGQDMVVLDGITAASWTSASGGSLGTE